MELDSWTCATTLSGTAAGPAELDALALEWLPVSVPGTAAGALRAAGKLPVGGADLDAADWWFRTRFPRPAIDVPARLELDGIATLGEVWLNGRLLLTTENMFRRYTVDLDDVLADDNVLVIGCRSLNEALRARRPRPRWKTRLVANQNLRWFRTTMLGRTKGHWPTGCAPVGPWRGVRIHEGEPVELTDVRLHTSLEHGAGIVHFALRVRSEAPVTGATLVVGDARGALDVTGSEIAGAVEVPEPQLWWPATHGDQPLYPVHVEICTDAGVSTHPLRRIGFRTITAAADTPALSVNDVEIFCRGACWTPVDPVSPFADRAALEPALRRFRDAGLNMVRLTGNLTYESDHFYDLCDELGILVWQDFMFATLDYPFDDEQFRADVDAEAHDVLDRLQARPAVAVLCGGSESCQQPAMLGLPVDDEFYVKGLAALVAQRCPDTVYWPNTPYGGALPFVVDEGTAHYFGISAYRRSLAGLRGDGVRFATECLAFSNVPDEQMIDTVRRQGVTVHDSSWKQTVPRDGGAAWDFEDVRDHYVRDLYGVDATAVRFADPDRYLDLGRAATAECFERTVTEWRRTASTCHGALVLHWRDYVPGAGWGVVDASGRPKSVYYALRRALRPTAVVFSDEGLNGVDVWAFNDGPEAVDGVLSVVAFSGTRRVETGEVAFALSPHGERRFRVEEILGSFLDVAYAYRFGPRAVDVLSASWRSADGREIARAVYAPAANAPLVTADIGLEARARRRADHHYEIEVCTREYAKCVTVDARDWEIEDNGFDLEPGGTVTIDALGDGPLRAEARALNGSRIVSVDVVDR
jgi:beta-mannosidase